MKRIETGRRFVFETRQYTPFDRLRVWLQNIKQAVEVLDDIIKTPPDINYTAEVEVKPDDPRYETASLYEEWLIIEDTYKHENPNPTN